MPWGAIIGGVVKVVEVMFRNDRVKVPEPPSGIDTKEFVGTVKEDTAVMMVANLLFQLDDTLFGNKFSKADESHARMAIKAAVYFTNKKLGHDWSRD